MILAVGLTPAWQQILEFDALQVGEVNRAKNAAWCASGKVLNVGRAIARFPGPHQVLCVAGGWTGAAIREDFARLDITAEWIDTQTPTRVCTSILDRATDVTTELVENSQALEPEAIARYRERFHDLQSHADLLVFSGSLPKSLSPQFYRDLLEDFANGTSSSRSVLGRNPAYLPAILDIRGPELLACAEFRPLLAKPNREELGHTFGKPLHSDTDLLAAMHDLHQRGIGCVVVTQGPDQVWALIDSSLLANPPESYANTPSHSDDETGAKLFQFQPPKRKVNNPIGCGDCMTGGIAWAIRTGHPILESIRFGIAAAVENVSTLLPAEFTLADVEATAKEVTSI